MDIKDSLKNFLYAGVGAAAWAFEKTGEVADTLIAKGETAVEQGKALNEELKHKTEEKRREKRSAEDILKTLTPEQKAALLKELSAEEVEEESKEETAESGADE